MNKYGRGGSAQGFHTTEWSYDYSCAIHGWDSSVTTTKYRENPYYGWPAEKLLKFRQELAKLAGHGNKLAICGGLNVREFAELKKEHLGHYIEYAYALCMFSFFTELSKEINLFWPDFKQEGGVQIIFHRNTNPKWQQAVGEAFALFKDKDRRLDGFSFQPATAPYLPLQAADMLAHRCREKKIEWVKDNIPLDIKTQFDKALFRKVELNAKLIRRKRNR